MKASQVATRVALHNWLVAASLMKLTETTVRGALSKGRVRIAVKKNSKKTDRDTPIGNWDHLEWLVVLLECRVSSLSHRLRTFACLCTEERHCTPDT